MEGAPPLFIQQEQLPEAVVVRDQVIVAAAANQTQVDDIREYQALLKTERDRILGLHPHAHVSLLLEAVKGTVPADSFATCNARERDAESCVLQALGFLDPAVWQARAEQIKKELLSIFAKSTASGDTHCYAQFSSFPPKAGRGAVHISQLAFFVEPPLGAPTDAVRTEVGAIVSGDVGKSIQVGQPPRTHVKLDPLTFGWGADGAAVNGIRLLGRAVVAFGIKALGRPIPAAWAGKWSSQFNAVTVKFQNHGNAQSRLITMWKESMIAWKQNEKPTPTRMAKSLLKFDLVGDGNIDQICKNYATQMKVVDASLQPQGNHMQRMKNFLNPARLPPRNWDLLEEYWTGTRYSDGAL